MEDYDDDYSSFRRESHFNPKDNRGRRGGNVKNYQKNRNIDIWHETEEAVWRNKAWKVNAEETCKRYKFNDLKDEPCVEPTENPLPILITKMDTLVAAKLMSESSDYVGFLNMASDFKAGGGVETGATAQEESISRRSNLVCTLNKSFYPLKEDEILFSPEVTIIRNERNEFDASNEFICSAISCAAIRKPDLKADGTYRNKHASLMENKILSIIKIAIVNGITHLVLGAFGCGAFGNPPTEVAKIFKKILVQDGFSRYFRQVIFAIYTRNDDNDKNFTSFLNVFSPLKEKV